MNGDRGVEDGNAGSGNGADAVVDGGDPRDGAAVVEAERESQSEVDFAADAFDDADDIGVAFTDGHEVDEADGAVGCLEGGFEDEGVVAIFACGFPVAGGADPPVAVFLGSEQGGEAGAGGKIGPAEPVDGALAIDEGRSLTIADQGIVFDL